jgi:LmbE family N-acetylglucosaminyl deacetylase
VPGLRPHLRRVHRRYLSFVARDVSNQVAVRSAVVLAPHPDDETIGCGGTILAKTTRATRVEVVFATDGGDPARRLEAIEACSLLGLDRRQITFLGFPDGELERHQRDLDERVAEVLQRAAPEEVYSPDPIDAHSDHRALATSVERALDAPRARFALYTYPIWFWNRWAWVDRTMPRWHQRIALIWRPLRFTARARVRSVDISAHLSEKRRALAAHESQVGLGNSERLDADWLATFLTRDEVFFDRSR